MQRERRARAESRPQRAVGGDARQARLDAAAVRTLLTAALVGFTTGARLGVLAAQCLQPWPAAGRRVCSCSSEREAWHLYPPRRGVAAAVLMPTQAECMGKKRKKDSVLEDDM